MLFSVESTPSGFYPIYLPTFMLLRSPMSFHFLNPLVSLQSFIIFSISAAFDTVAPSLSFLKYFIPLSSATHGFLLNMSTWIAQRPLIFNKSKHRLLIFLLKFSFYIVFLISLNANSTLPVSQVKTLEQVLTLLFIPDPKFCTSNLISWAPFSKYI